MEREKFKSVEQYLNSFSPEIRTKLETIRQAIRAEAPEAEELISYNMPGFRQFGILVWYAGYKGHIGFYPSSSGIQFFRDEIAQYKNSKGAVQFPIEKEIPVELVRKIVRFRLMEEQEKAFARKLKKGK